VTDDDKPTPHRSHKDTKKWCRGKVGVEHKPECFKFDAGWVNAGSMAVAWRELVCTECGKKLASWMPMRLLCTDGSISTHGGERPDWVTF
jgi:hypothetical protein